MEKQTGLRPMIEGKSPLPFPAYIYLAKKTLRSVGDYRLSTFAHVFLTFSWCLIARCVSVSSLLFEHISWQGDALKIVFPTPKTDPDSTKFSPKHVYANPLCPHICPILSFAIFFFTLGMRRIGSRCVVFGDNVKGVEDRFGTWLSNFVGEDTMRAAFRDFGVEKTEVGTHSFRKGVATFLSGMVSGPSPIAIYLRAGWSLGPVQGRYIMEGQGGDQLCGRAASGLTLTSTEFASLPPHFDTRDGSILTVAEWENIVPGYIDYFPSDFRPVISYLLASLIHHKQWLMCTLPEEHPLFLSTVWISGVMEKLAPKVLCGNGRNEFSGLTATGVMIGTLPSQNKLVSLLTTLKLIYRQ